MKRAWMILGGLVLAATLLWAFPTISRVTASMFKDDDPDVPRMWKNAMSKEEYMLPPRGEHCSAARRRHRFARQPCAPNSSDQATG